MSTRITLTLAVAVIAFTSFASTVGNDSRNHEHTFKSAQYCMPEYDFPGETRIYC
jgi:hypothetical protein